MSVSRRVTDRRLGIAIVLVAAATGLALDLAIPDVSEWYGAHQFVTAVLAEAILLGAVYLGIDGLVNRNEELRWRDASAEPLRMLVVYAEQLDNLIDKIVFADRQRMDWAGIAGKPRAPCARS